MASEPDVRAQYEALAKENKQLKQSVEKLEQENHDLKRSVYELTLKLESVHVTSDPFPMQELLSTSSRQTGQSPPSTKEFPAASDENIEENDPRTLFEKAALRSHTGAVYTAKFSPCGKLLASGSLDKRVLLWDVTTKFHQQQLASLSRHNQLVIDVSWANDSSQLLSASYDHTVKRWDVTTNELLHSCEVPGLVQCVSYSEADNADYFFGTSKRCIHHMDTRADSYSTWKNEAMINSLYVSPDGQYVITGDSKGMLKTWDVRMGACIEELSQLNDNGGHAISHVQASKKYGSDEEGRFLAVNSYDNILRVYDRRAKLISSSHGQDQMQLSFSVTGHKNKNWPIKSSFFRGDGTKYQLGASKHRRHQQSLQEDDSSDFQDSERTDQSREMSLLATGSADNRIYLHDVSLNVSNGHPSAQLVQKIDAHSDRVYCVDFHPSEPILASASADFSVKIWLPRINKSKT